MYRLSHKSIKFIANLLKQSSKVDYKQCRTLASIPSLQFIQYRWYSNDSSSKSPLSNLLSNGKDIVNEKKAEKEKTQEQTEEAETKKQREQSWRTMKLSLAFIGASFSLLGGYLIVTLGAPEKHNGEPIRDEFSDYPLVKQYILRTLRELDYYRKMIKEPSREKLLPDPLQYPYLQPKYTLVLELTDVLVHPDWTYNTGWRFKKRPLLDYFLETLQGHYEIVIYTAEQGMTVFPLIEAIDPKNLISYKLVRDATHFTGGHHVKSLNNLNRDLTKVVVVDWNKNNLKFNPENLFQIRRWSGNDDDTSLLDLAQFLKTIAENDIEDVREVLKNYSQFDDPIEAFKEKQKKLLDELEAQAAAKKEQEKSKVSRWTPFIFRRNY